jgi:alpha-ketoglutarate-dependent 2,4-dichlorophenoxyacetate dioxygenase
MPLSATPLHPVFAAAISGLDLNAPAAFALHADIVAVMDEYAVCVFANAAPLSDETHIAFSRGFGPIEARSIITVTGRTRPRLRYGELIDVSNLDPDGNILADNDRRLMFKRADRLWHTDMSFHPNRATYSLLSAHVIPPAGGDTQFADMRAAYDALPAALQARIEPLVAEHSIWHSRAVAGYPEPTEEERLSRPPARHRLVQFHPGARRKTLYLASHASHILGMPIDEGRALLRELSDFATAPRFVYTHRWQVGEVVMWDNRCTMHRGTDFADTVHRRDLRRTTVREAPIAAEALS